MKVAPAAKKKAGKLDLFSIEFQKIVVFIVLYVAVGVCCVHVPPFLSLFSTSNVIATAQ